MSKKDCMEKSTVAEKKLTTFGMMTYSLGACSESLLMNSFFGFAMLYYTKALGLSPEKAGIAAFVATLWDAISDPIMGYISDKTKSRFGRRHPYMLFGGLAMISCFYFVWYVPDFFKSNMTVLFWYLVAINLLLRTCYTVFVVPYTALGFEICNDYKGRGKIQGIRNGFNMAANMFGCAMAWTLFFNNNNSDDIKATQVVNNYVSMGTVFSFVSIVFLFAMLIFTVKYMKDSRNQSTVATSIVDFFRETKDIVMDKYPRWVFVFSFFVILGVVLVSSLQMYVFDDFMVLSGWQKTVTHGATMVGMGIGSFCCSIFVRRFDKKGAVCIGVIWGVVCELVLAALFLTGYLKPGQLMGGIPISFIVFTVFHGAYWFGNGIMMPVAVSMMADISELNEIETGTNKTGSYAAMYSLVMKLSISLGLLFSGYCLDWIGFVSGPNAEQTYQVVWRICALTLVVGPLTSLMALLLISRYPVSECFIEEMRQKVKSLNLSV